MSLSFFDDLGTTLADVEEVRSSWITEPGNYAARVSKIEDTTSKSGSPMLVISYEITEGSAKGSEQKDRLTYTRDKSDKDYDTKMGYIKARFVDLGLPPDYRGQMDNNMFNGVDVILTMTYQRENSSRPGANINPTTNKPYVQISAVTRRNVAEVEKAAPVIPDLPSAEGSFFS